VEREEGGIRVEDQEGVIQMGILLGVTYRKKVGVLQEMVAQAARQTATPTMDTTWMLSVLDAGRSRRSTAMHRRWPLLPPPGP
jgi:hypothetical protein